MESQQNPYARRLEQLETMRLGTPPYPKWVGVVLGLLLHGTAHFLSGERAAGLKWYFGLFGCSLAAMAFLAIPGTIPFSLGSALLLASAVLWFVMLKQSYRPVRWIGFLGWLAVLFLAIILNNSLGLLVRQLVHPFKVPTGSMQPTIYGIHGDVVPADLTDKPGGKPATRGPVQNETDLSLPRSRRRQGGGAWQ